MIIVRPSLTPVASTHRREASPPLNQRALFRKSALIASLLVSQALSVAGCQHFARERRSREQLEQAAQRPTFTQPRLDQLKITEASYRGVLARTQEDILKLKEPAFAAVRLERSLAVQAELSLSPARDSSSWSFGSERSFSLHVPPALQAQLKIEGDCRPSRATSRRTDERAAYQLTCQRGEERPQAKLTLIYTVPWRLMRGHHTITEGERQYHITHLAASLGGEVWLGFSQPGSFKRAVRLKALKGLQLVGHEVSGSASLKEISSPRPSSDQSKKLMSTASLRESNQEPAWRELVWESSPTAPRSFSTFFTFGSWEAPQDFTLKAPRPDPDSSSDQVRASGEGDALITHKSRLLTPLGSRFYRVGKVSLRRLQIKRIKERAKRLVFNSLRARQQAQSLLWITLPDHPNYTPPDLRRHGVIFMDESWFALDAQSARSLTVHDQLKLYEHLYVALGDEHKTPTSAQSTSSPSPDARLLHALAEWSALNHLSAPRGARRPEADSRNSRAPSLLELYKLELLHQLHMIAGESHRPLNAQNNRPFSQIFSGTLSMLQAWLSHQRAHASSSTQQLRDQLGALIKDAPLRESAPTSLQEIGRQLNRLGTQLKPIFESFLSNQGLPLVHVKWTQQVGKGEVSVRFTLSQRPFMPHERAAQLKPEMWIIPVCLRLGIRDNPSRVHCLLLDQPERSDYEVSLEAPLLWVHPNADQSGIYLWSLEDDAFESLLRAEEGALSPLEELSRVEMSSMLLETSLGSPKIYLKAVQELALRAHDPLTITHLFKHLNQIVLYFGEQGDQVGVIERWASGILQGVMMSQPRFSRAPLKQFTQLQLAQWDQDEVGLEFNPIAKKTKKMIKRFLRPTTSQATFEDDVVKVDLETIQYPLLISALSGDQKLWDQLRDKLAESEDLPLIRLVVIRALVQFVKPQLFHQTLKLLTLKLNELDELTDIPDTSGSGGDQGAGKELAEDVDASGKDTSTAEAPPEVDQEIAEADGASDGESEDESAHDHDSLKEVPLRAEDTLELVRLVRSHRARKLAWDWFTTQDTPVETLIHYGARGDIQEGILRWASAVCDASRLDQLKRIYEGYLGFRQSVLQRHRMYLSAAQRCVKIRRLRPVAEQLIKASLTESR